MSLAEGIDSQTSRKVRYLAENIRGIMSHFPRESACIMGPVREMSA